jgi:hypothetical protein
MNQPFELAHELVPALHARVEREELDGDNSAGRLVTSSKNRPEQPGANLIDDMERVEGHALHKAISVLIRTASLALTARVPKHPGSS